MKKFAMIVLALALVITGLASANGPEPRASTGWPADMPLPAFKLPHEKAATTEPTDDVTPPPTELVRCVAEFEYQEGIQLAYPFSPWNDIFVEIVRESQEVGVVYIVVPDQAERVNCDNLLLANGVPLNHIEYQFHPIDAMWSRDYGAHFVWGQTSGEIALLDQQYYDSRPNDDEIPDFQASQWHMNFYETALYHEGGNFMSDGHGNVMCSDVLYDNNPSWTPQQCEEEVMDYFGASHVYVYPRIPGTWDATGHIDLWAKMLNDTTVMVAQMQPNDPNYSLIEGHAARMATVPTVYGTPFHVVRCPMPAPYFYWVWYYYKSFINSVIFNGKVLVPIYATEPAMTTQALAAYQAAMPNYEVVGIYCDNIAPAGGAIHCVTIGIADHIQDYVHAADVSITPIAPPIQIPPGGGSFQYNASLHNLETDSIYTEVWVEARLPNGSVMGPLLEKPVALAANGTASRALSQYVPGTAPAGTYTYTMYAGSRLPRVVNDSSFFNFSKTGAGDDIRFDQVGWWADEISGLSDVSAALPVGQALLSAYPNPFNPATQLRYTLPQAGSVSLAIYDLKGSKVQEIFSGYRSAGEYVAVFTAEHLPSGIYFARLETGTLSVTEKLIFMK